MDFKALDKSQDQLRRFFSTDDSLILLDQHNQLEAQDAGLFRLSIMSLINDLGQNVHEFSGGLFSSQNLLSKLEERSPKEGGIFTFTSLFRELCSQLDSQAGGVICIHESQVLPKKSIHMLSRLINHSRRHSLNWRFILLADAKSMKPMSLTQLGIKYRHSKSNEKTSNRQEKWRFPISANIAAVFLFSMTLMFGLWLSASETPQSEITEQMLVTNIEHISLMNDSVDQDIKSLRAQSDLLRAKLIELEAQSKIKLSNDKS